jgi:glycine hydroxymethyltransferase
VGIYVNRNLVPFDERPPLVASGIRAGTPAVTFRGFGPAEIDQVADVMQAVLDQPADEPLRGWARGQVRDLCRRFPIYGSDPGRGSEAGG